MRAHADNVRTLFDGKAQNWTQKYVPGGALEHRLQAFAQPLAILFAPPARVLDFGCGTGDLARYVARQGYAVTGCDSSPAMIEMARGLDSGVRWVQLAPDWTALPFGTQSFNAVIASSVLEYVDRPEVVVQEIARILTPGGALLATVPNPRHPIRRVERTARAMLALGPLTALAYRIPRLSAYLRYLAVSRNRYAISDWKGVIERSGLIADDTDSLHGPAKPLALLSARRVVRPMDSTIGIRP